MDKLQQLFASCNGEVIVYYNGHKGNYQSVDEYINDWDEGNERKDITMEVYAEMVDRNTVIALQVYPNNPMSFYLIFHCDLEKAAVLALNMLGSVKQ